jgi:hypothetical protein
MINQHKINKKNSKLEPSEQSLELVQQTLLSSNSNLNSRSVVIISDASLVDGDTFLSIKSKNGLNPKITLREEEDLIIQELINEIWTTYNENNDACLDKREMAEFLFITLIEAGVRAYDNLQDCMEDPTFQKVFAHFDSD